MNQRLLELQVEYAEAITRVKEIIELLYYSRTQYPVDLYYIYKSELDNRLKELEKIVGQYEDEEN